MTTGFNRNGEVISSLLSGGPLGEFHGLVQLYHLVLEHFDLGGTSTLDIEDESVHQAVVGLGGQVGTEHGPRDCVWRAFGVGTDHTGFNRLILPVQDDLLPTREWCVVKVVAANDKNTVVVKLLDLLNCGHARASLPIRPVDKRLADSQEGSVESVAELQSCRDALAKFRVCQSPIDSRMLHL